MEDEDVVEKGDGIGAWRVGNILIGVDGSMELVSTSCSKLSLAELVEDGEDVYCGELGRVGIGVELPENPSELEGEDPSDCGSSLEYSSASGRQSAAAWYDRLACSSSSSLGAERWCIERAMASVHKAA